MSRQAGVDVARDRVDDRLLGHIAVALAALGAAALCHGTRVVDANADAVVADGDAADAR